MLSTEEQVNRNKKSLGLSFASAEGQSILHKLAAQSDVLVENYLPNTLAKYHLDYDTLSSINPSLIYASITGYGQTGPYSSRAGYDVMVRPYLSYPSFLFTSAGPLLHPILKDENDI